jgi:hypothetical protein
MRSKLVKCSAANLVLTSVVMADSLTYVTALAVSESSAAIATADPSNVPTATQVMANLVFMIFPY